MPDLRVTNYRFDRIQSSQLYAALGDEFRPQRVSIERKYGRTLECRVAFVNDSDKKIHVDRKICLRAWLDGDLIGELSLQSDGLIVHPGSTVTASFTISLT